jgi:hypothetical protein
MAEQDISGYIAAYAEEKNVELGISHATDEINKGYSAAQGRYTPYAGVGAQGMQNLGNLGSFSFNPSDLSNDPGYQFEKQQGQAGLNASAFAKGIGASGATAQAMDYFNQQLASTKYGEAYNRALSTYGTNLGAAQWETNFGAGIAGNQATLDLGQATDLANLQMGKYNARAAGYAAAGQVANQQGQHLQEIGSMSGGGGGGSSGGGSGGGGSASSANGVGGLSASNYSLSYPQSGSSFSMGGYSGGAQ